MSPKLKLPGTQRCPIKRIRGSSETRLVEIRSGIRSRAQRRGGAYADQSGSEVKGDQTGRDKIDAEVVTIYNTTEGATVVDQLLALLAAEIKQNAQCSGVITRLQRYFGGLAIDEAADLESKLLKAGRKEELRRAMEGKEEFAMLLDEWGHFASAQKIFAYLLARAEHVFNSEIEPQIGILNKNQLNSQFNSLIIDPTVRDCGASVFEIDHIKAMGMIYWLADQCFVRWHK